MRRARMLVRICFFLLAMVLSGSTGAAIAGGLIGAELFLRRFSFRDFNLLVVGLLSGYLLAFAVTSIIDLIALEIHPQTRLGLTLGSLFFGAMFGLRVADHALIFLGSTKEKQTAHEAGGFLDVKVQRIGRESDQGVGYLEDGTMVVINGGSDHIGETLNVRILSIKNSSAGRMIFCNAPEQVCRGV